MRATRRLVGINAKKLLSRTETVGAEGVERGRRGGGHREEEH